MNISYNWLKQYIQTNLSADEVAKLITSIGLEVGSVEEYQPIKGGLQGLVIGEVKTCAKHPDSDHLSITTVDVGTGEILPVVCGAPNVAAGQKVVVATIGTILYNGDEQFTIKKSKIRGAESMGMICAEDEIGIGTSHAGIIVLPADAKVGTPAAEYFKVENDYILEVDITPNRIDAASHLGVARDLALALQQKSPISYTKPSVDAFKVDNHNLTIPVEIIANEACPRYAGVTLTGIKVAPSPEWLQQRLRAIGLNPINNVVDVTNFILHELGQPLHAFDASHIKGNKVVVRTLPEGTKFKTLDDVERSLSAEDLMICNISEGMCIAGVFGGIDSGVTENTTSLFIESAYFNPVSVRKTARRHGLHTEASFLFERGVDPNITIFALKRAALLIKEVAGGQISSDIVDVYPKPIMPFDVTLRYSQVNRLIGENIPREKVKSILKGLEIEIISETPEQLQLKVPPYRVDVQREADVIEDILRIYGYNTVLIRETVNSTLAYAPKPNLSYLRNLISNTLVGAGLNEMMANSLTKAAYYKDEDPCKKENTVNIFNPLSQDLNGMRQTLLFGALEAVAFNTNRQNSDLKFFEFGNCYFYKLGKNAGPGLNSYSETEKLSLVLTGNALPESWAEKQKTVSFFALKTRVEQVLEKLGIDTQKVEQESFSNNYYSEGLKLSLNGNIIAELGIVSRKLRKDFDIKNEVFFAEIDWTRLMKTIKNHKVTYTELPKFPEVRRDLSLLLAKQVTFDSIRKTALKVEKKLLKRISLFDVYEGEKIGEGNKSYAISFILQDESKTLNDKQIDKIMESIAKSLEQEFGAKIR
jgi:phenylalanyl-tRNA synthetase beta chain